MPTDLKKNYREITNTIKDLTSQSITRRTAKSLKKATDQKEKARAMRQDTTRAAHEKKKNEQIHNALQNSKLTSEKKEEKRRKIGVQAQLKIEQERKQAEEKQAAEKEARTDAAQLNILRYKQVEYIR